MKIVADEHIPFVQEYFGSQGELVLRPGRLISPQDVKDADMLLVRSITPVNAALLQDTQVKFVGSVTAGADHLDTQWLDKKAIAWHVAKGFNAPPVADYVVSVVAALQRKNYLSQYGAKVAVIGVGSVGRLVAERFRLLGCQVIECDPLRAQEEPDFIHQSLDDVSDVDFISLHVPLVKNGEHPTYHFINKEFLLRQKPGCILLNASRGAVINSEDLLTDGKHLRWCLDVWEHEPRINQAILEYACIATPHIAGYSVQSKRRGVDMIYQIACEKGLINSQAVPVLTMPQQTLTFAGQQHHWQDIILGIFNPFIMTAIMRAGMQSSEHPETVFDEMRHEFNYRHEFAYTSIFSDDLLESDKRVLTSLGVKLPHSLSLQEL